MSHDPRCGARRRFLRNSLAALAGGYGFFGAPASLSLLNRVWAQGAGDDYRALVCVFLLGGNDGHNLVVPRGAEYALYAQRRRGLTLPQASLLPLSPQGWGGYPVGLHPAMPEMAQLFGQGRLAILGSVGALLQPVTREEHQNGSVPLPPQLFSHNDQQDFWQNLEVRSSADPTPVSGWGGRLADLVHASYNADATLSMNLSLAGTNAFQTGHVLQSIGVDTGEIRAIRSRDPDAAAAFQSFLATPQSNALADEYRRTTRRAIDDYATLATALDGVGIVLQDVAAGKFNHMHSSSIVPSGRYLNRWPVTSSR